MARLRPFELTLEVRWNAFGAPSELLWGSFEVSFGSPLGLIWNPSVGTPFGAPLGLLWNPCGAPVEPLLDPIDALSAHFGNPLEPLWVSFGTPLGLPLMHPLEPQLGLLFESL